MTLTSLRIERTAVAIPGGQVVAVEHIEPGLASFREPPADIKLAHIVIHGCVDALVIVGTPGLDYSLYQVLEEVQREEVPDEVMRIFQNLGAGKLTVFKQKGVVEDKYSCNMFWAVNK